jgi:hypothetical protein
MPMLRRSTRSSGPMFFLKRSFKVYHLLSALIDESRSEKDTLMSNTFAVPGNAISCIAVPAAMFG